VQASVFIILKSHTLKRRVEMKTFSLKRFLLTAFFVLLLISYGCGGASSNSGGIGGSGVVSQGTVSGYGSIIVNGTVFDTTNARIIVEGEEVGIGDAVALNNLDVGKVVTVYGTDGNNAVADRVTYNDSVEGPVESITVVDPDTRKDIVVLGQTIIVNVVTEFKGTSFDTLATNDVVEVSGFVDDMGRIWATFLEKTDGVVFEVTGFVENLDVVQETFEINNLTVDYSAADTSGLPAGEPVKGLFVEVEGTLTPTDELLATEIEPGDELDVEDSDEIEIEGFVTDATSAPAEFTVGTQVVQTDADTLFVDGTAGDILPGQKLEAEGTLVNGILLATEVEFWEPDQIEVEGLVTDDTLAPAEFTIDDTQVVQTDAGTLYEGGTEDDIALGVLIEVKGVPVDIDRSVLVADKVSFEEN
jgi:hypothetical protein